uniref:Uncharacterized protein n=1 Tax=viral metagenome TaxID=1070528 RepID=A0A6C0BVG6_9ZZZZ
MGSYKRDFSKKVKRNIRKNTKIRKTNKTYKKRISYKNKRRNGNKSNKIGGLSFLRSSFSSSDSNNSRNSDIENNIEKNIEEPFIVKGDKLLLIKIKTEDLIFDPNDTSPNRISNRRDLHDKYRKSDCKKLSYPSNKECEITRKLYDYKAAYALAYDRDNGYNSLKVYLPEDQNYRAYPDTAIISAEDFNIYPIREFTQDGKFSILKRTDEEKREILKKNINANLMRRKI